MDEDRLVATARELTRALTPGDLDHTLERITAAAVELLPDVELASISIRHGDGTLDTVAPTDRLLCDIDLAQYELREGPCYEAAEQAVHVIAPNLAGDERFPRYAEVAVAAGIRAQAGLRLFEHRQAHGALNLYSRHVGAFSDMAQLRDLFAHQSAMAIDYAHEIEDLRAALKTRSLIGQAIGIVMERYNLTPERAFAFLTRLSSHRNVKMRQLAQELVTEVGEQEPERPAS